MYLEVDESGDLPGLQVYFKIISYCFYLTSLPHVIVLYFCISVIYIFMHLLMMEGKHNSTEVS